MTDNDQVFEQAVRHIKGDGVEKNAERAVTLFMQAAAAGHSKAQYNLGVMFMSGIGAEKDRDQARNLFQQAAAQGHRQAILALEKIGASHHNVPGRESVTRPAVEDEKEGKQLLDPIACQACGANVKPTLNFCTSCGKRTSDQVVSVLTPAAPTSPLITQLPSNSDSKRGTIGKFADKVTDITGVERLEGFDVRELFSLTFSKHDVNEVENSFAIGTPDTTPNLSLISSDWPKPWMFFRALLFSLSLYGTFWFAWDHFHNINVFPGLIIVGSFAVPISTLILFFELNTPKNISLYQVTRLVLIGGGVSILISLVLFSLTSLDSLFGASAAGFIEETGKLAALLLVASKLDSHRYRFTLNGLLFGAAVGTGFAAFESAGYALRFALLHGANAANEIIILRGILSPFAHIVWTALAAGALWKVKRGDRLMTDMLTDKRFYSVFFLVVGMHFVWNLDANGPMYAKYWILGFVAWVMVFSFIQTGLKEIRAEQESNVFSGSADPVDSSESRQNSIAA
jgi:protease PrsW